MEPNHYKFGGGASESILHPLVAIVLILAVVGLLVLPRKYVVPVFLLTIFLIPAGQQVIVAGIHIYAHRFIVLAGLARMMRARQAPYLAGGWNRLDTVFFASVLTHAVAFTLLYLVANALVNQIGFVLDWLGTYIVLRCAIRNDEDISCVIRCFALLVLIFACSMVNEQLTGHNVFGWLGGVRLDSEVREGHIRSEAVFQHAILAGVFAATLFPLFVALGKITKSKILLIGSCSLATMMVVTSFCSTPLLAYFAGVLGILMWPMRDRMRWVRWGLVAGLVLLNFAMHAPVWYVIQHVNIVEGSSAGHRAELVNTFFMHFSDWWLLGTDSNGSWGYLMFDTSNQYIQQGITGGLLSLIFFVATIVEAFRMVGRARRRAQAQDRRTEWLVWLLGAALFANVMAFFGISYFDQTRVAWCALLAMISAAAAVLASAKPMIMAAEPVQDSFELVNW